MSAPVSAERALDGQRRRPREHALLRRGDRCVTAPHALPAAVPALRCGLYALTAPYQSGISKLSKDRPLYRKLLSLRSRPKKRPMESEFKDVWASNLKEEMMNIRRVVQVRAGTRQGGGGGGGGGDGDGDGGQR